MIKYQMGIKLQNKLKIKLVCLQRVPEKDVFQWSSGVKNSKYPFCPGLARDMKQWIRE